MSAINATSPIGTLIADLFAADTDARLPPPLKPAATKARDPHARRKLWELEHKHHCPIIGTCLGVDELRRFARRHDFGDERSDPFALHVETASRVDTRNALSEDIQKHLDRKYAVVLARFANLAADLDVRAAWQEHLARGEVAGPLWATLTHKATSPDTHQVVYADIHMLSHQVGAGQAADARRLAHLERENGELKASAASERRQRGIVEDRLRDEVRGLQAKTVRLLGELGELDALRQRLADLESGVAIVELGRKLLALSAAHEQLAATARRVGELERELRDHQDELRATRRARDQAGRERDALERLLLPPEAGTQDGGDRRCDLCSDAREAAAPARCVLCVGGRTSLLAQYRALAERLGIRLVHHDGGQEEAVSRLPDMINGADAVICPTDCVSHSAYYRLKDHCKRTGKPCLLFKGAGVSSFAVALDRLADGRVSLAATRITPP